MRILGLALTTALLAAAPAAAAPFGELPSTTVSGGVTCLRATGAPGELFAWAPEGGRLWRATPSGLVAEATLPLGDGYRCPVAAAQPNGAGIAALALPKSIRVALREPGGAWGAPIDVPSRSEKEGLTAAISDRGDAIVAWREWRNRSWLIRAARRPAGGAFGAPITVGARSGDDDPENSLVSGIAANGDAIVVWTRRVLRESESPGSELVEAAIAPPGAPFGPAQQLASDVNYVPALAVAADGRALAALPAGRSIRVAERAPGAGFAPARTVSVASSPVTAVALQPDGSALIGWGGGTEGVGLARRSGTGEFGPPIEVAPARAAGPDGALESGRATGVAGDGQPDDQDGGLLRAAFRPDGRAMLTWNGATGGPGMTWTAAHVTTVAPDGSAETQVLGGPLRDAGSVAPLVLDTGLAAVAWGDNIMGGDGRLHLATEGGADTPQAAFPQVRIGAPRDSSLRLAQSLVLPVSCSAACDVRASARGMTAQVTLAGAGRAALTFDRFFFSRWRARSGRVAITVVSGPPGARAVQRQVVRPRLRFVPPPPLPRILDLAARRDGKDVDVTWRTDRSDPGVLYWVQSSVQHDTEENMPSDGVKKGGRSFHVRLRNVPKRARWVRVMANDEIGSRRASVRIE